MALVRVVDDAYLVGAIVNSKLPQFGSETTSHRREFQSQKRCLLQEYQLHRKRDSWAMRWFYMTSSLNKAFLHWRHAIESNNNNTTERRQETPHNHHITHQLDSGDRQMVTCHPYCCQRRYKWIKQIRISTEHNP